MNFIKILFYVFFFYMVENVLYMVLTEKYNNLYKFFDKYYYIFFNVLFIIVPIGLGIVFYNFNIMYFLETNIVISNELLSKILNYIPIVGWILILCLFKHFLYFIFSPHKDTTLSALIMAIFCILNQLFVENFIMKLCFIIVGFIYYNYLKKIKYWD